MSISQCTFSLLAGEQMCSVFPPFTSSSEQQRYDDTSYTIVLKCVCSCYANRIWCR